jgi:hypothetical protein
MVIGCVFFEVGAECSNFIEMSFGFKGLDWAVEYSET